MTVASYPRSRRVSPCPQPHARAREGGFTLVEVSLAIGIVAYAFVAIFSLLPVGMTNFRRSLDTSLTTQIAQRLINDLKQSSFDTVSKIPLTRRYFTEQGDEVATTGAAGSETPNDGKWLYAGEVAILHPEGTLLPGTNTAASPNLMTVTIRIAANPGHKASPFASGSKTSYRTFTSLIARN